MRKNSLRYKALKRCAQVNENVAVDLLKLKRAGVDVKNFVNQVENIDAPYSILENYNFMSIDDVDVHDIKESLMELGASRKLLSEAVFKHNDTGDSYTLVNRGKWTDPYDENDPDGWNKRRLERDKDIDTNLYYDNTSISSESEEDRNIGKNIRKSVMQGDKEYYFLFKWLPKLVGDIYNQVYTMIDKKVQGRWEDYIQPGWTWADWRSTISKEISPKYYKVVKQALRTIGGKYEKNYSRAWRDIFNDDKKYGLLKGVRDKLLYDLENFDTEERDVWHRLMSEGISQVINDIYEYLKQESIDIESIDIDESCSFKNIRKMLRESKKELDPKADLKKRQAELDKIVEEIKNDTNLDKKSAKKYTTRLKKIKDLKDLKKAKAIVKKLSKLYPDAADLLNEATVLKFVNAVRGKKAVLNENLKINNFHISTYSLKELKECYNKVNKNIGTLKRRLKKSALNESYSASDIRKIKETLKKQTKLLGMLDEEISWKMLILQKGGLDNVRFLNEGDDSKKEEEKAEDAASTSLDDLFNNIGDDMEDDIEKEESDDKKEDKNDSNEDVELDSITITMKSEDAANALKDALVEKGVPEDVIDIEETEEEEEDESKNESVKYSNKFMRLFEDEMTEDDEADNNKEESDDNNSEEDSDNDSNDDDSNDDNSEDKAYNVTLTDTDYVNSLKDVMVDEYGYTEDEFWDSIGGKPVDDEDNDSDDKDDEESDKDDSDNKDDEDDDTSELDSIGADIFGEQ